MYKKTKEQIEKHKKLRNKDVSEREEVLREVFQHVLWKVANPWRSSKPHKDVTHPEMIKKHSETFVWLYEQSENEKGIIFPDLDIGYDAGYMKKVNNHLLVVKRSNWEDDFQYSIKIPLE